MAKNTPAFQFYPTDFLGGVGLMSDEATGIYIKLLSALWVQGNLLPFCFQKLARVALTDAATLERVWDEMSEKFIIENDTLKHARFAKDMAISEQRRKAGSKGGSKTQSKRGSKTQNKPQSKSEATSRSMKYEDRSMKNEGLEGGNGFTPPTPDEVQKYIDQQHRANPNWPVSEMDADEFCDHYGSQGWQSGNGIPIADWKSKVRQWGRKETRSKTSTKAASKIDLDNYVDAMEVRT